MTHRIILASVLAVASLSAAGAASAQDWSGPYVSLSLGGDFADDDEGEITLFDTNLDGTFGDTVRTTTMANAFASSMTQPAGFCGGSAVTNALNGGCSSDDQVEIGVSGRLGWDVNVGGFVFGVVGEVANVEARDTTTAFSITPAAYQFSRGIDGAVYAARARIGSPFGRYLPYVTAGFAAGEVEERYTTTNTANSFTPVTSTSDADGFQVGAGLEYWVNDRISIGAEYLYTALDVDEPLVTRVGPGTAPPTNPFLLVNPAGTDTRRESDEFNYHGVRLSVTARF